MDTLNSINFATLPLLAIIGTFVIFRLQWLRKEIDDYRGRIIQIVHPSKLQRDAFSFDQKQILVKLEEKIKEDSSIKDQDEMYGLDDEELKSYVKIFKKVSQAEYLPLIDRGYAGTQEVSNLIKSFKLFERRLHSRYKVLCFFFFSLLFISIMFIITLPTVINFHGVGITNLLNIFIIGYLSILFGLFIFLRNDYK